MKGSELTLRYAPAHPAQDHDVSTVVVGFIETVTYRNGVWFFSDFEIETVLTPQMRATETTVT